VRLVNEVRALSDWPSDNETLADGVSPHTTSARRERKKRVEAAEGPRESLENLCLFFSAGRGETFFSLSSISYCGQHSEADGAPLHRSMKVVPRLRARVHAWAFEVIRPCPALPAIHPSGHAFPDVLCCQNTWYVIARRLSLNK
jgi:hypothetical protein